ncbi:MAG TPA: hypothetical protein VI968_02180 [archaeon]|nr:hypothetical protein [archaeon]
MNPKCCGKDMRVTLETNKFYEMLCEICKDTVYMKKDEVDKPILLDD